VALGSIAVQDVRVMAEDRSGDGVGLKKDITLSADESLI
jgi:hypothetical protein